VGTKAGTFKIQDNKKTQQLFEFTGLIELILAERAGFEPAMPFDMPDFESGTFDHSATSPNRTAIIALGFLCFGL
jgi:hypothetical protein